MASFRQFKVIGFEGNQELVHTFKAEDLFNKQESELMYSMQEESDKILDLREGQSIFVNINRDNSEYKGVVLRTQ